MKNLNRFLIVFLLACLSELPTRLPEPPAAYPRANRQGLDALFKSHSTKITHKKLQGKLSPVSFKKFYNFRTRIRRAAKKKVNFGGRYRLVFWGCGTECSSGVLINLANGRIFQLPTAEWGYEFRPDSLLLAENPPSNKAGVNRPDYAWPVYHHWNGKKFILLKDTGK